jgi:hypothetical protein
MRGANSGRAWAPRPPAGGGKRVARLALVCTRVHLAHVAGPSRCLWRWLSCSSCDAACQCCGRVTAWGVFVLFTRTVLERVAPHPERQQLRRAPLPRLHSPPTRAESRIPQPRGPAPARRPSGCLPPRCVQCWRAQHTHTHTHDRTHPRADTHAWKAPTRWVLVVVAQSSTHVDGRLQGTPPGPSGNCRPPKSPQPSTTPSPPSSAQRPHPPTHSPIVPAHCPPSQPPPTANRQPPPRWTA